MAKTKGQPPKAKSRTRADVAASMKAEGYKYSHPGEYNGREVDVWVNKFGRVARAYIASKSN